MQKYKIIFNLTRRQILTAKKAVLILLFAALSTPLLAQVNPVVRITQNNPTIAEVFSTIEQQTGMTFSYDVLLDLTRRVTIAQSQTTLSVVMKAILSDTGRNYIIVDKNIMIKMPQQQETPSPIKNTTQPIEQVAPAMHKIEGVVTGSEANQPLYNVMVELRGENSIALTTDKDGHFVYERLPVGHYRVVASHPDYGQAEVDVELSARQSERIVFVLNPINPGQPIATEIPQDGIIKAMPIATYLQGTDPGMRQKASRWAIKTNLLADLLATVNIGVELRIAPKMTLNVPFSFNGWDIKKDVRMRHMLIQPELRFWGHEAFNRHFFGINLMYGIYNVGGINMPFNWWQGLKNNRYEGELYSIGATVGHQWILGRRLNLEVTFGVGYVYTEYDKGRCIGCSDVVEKGSKHYFGPTKLGVSLIYMIK